MIHRHIIILVAVCLLLVTVCEAMAEDTPPLLFASEEWKDATNRDGTGLYWDILRAIYEPRGYKIKPVIRSYKGSVTLVTTKIADAMIGAYKDEIEDGIYPEHHFAVDIVMALFKKRPGLHWTGVDSIKGKTVAWVEGYLYDEYLPAAVVNSIMIRQVDTKKTAFNLMDISRIDVLLDAEGDLKDFFVDHPEYQLDDYMMKRILELKLYMVFTDNEKGKQLADLFDQGFLRLLKTGEIKALYKTYAHSNFMIPSGF